jgi:hypothetical protein
LVARLALFAYQIEKVFFGKNWCGQSYKNVLESINWQQAILQKTSSNSIATIAYHSCYYVQSILQVLHSNTLTTKDADSFLTPKITSAHDWQNLIDEACNNAQKVIMLLRQLPESTADASFANEKYGTIAENISGIIEHLYYHLGQIVLLKNTL